MSLKDEYTFKEIFLALRKEYLNTQERLKALKEFSSYSDKDVFDYYFFVEKLDKNPRLELIIEAKRPKKVLLREKFEKTFLPDFALNLRLLRKSYLSSYKLKKDENGNYVLDNKVVNGNYVLNNKVIDIDLSNENFKVIADEILSSDFSKNLYSDALDYEVNRQEMNLLPDFMIVINTIENITIYYYPKSDRIKILWYKIHPKNTKKLLDYVFNFTFSKELFSEYLKDVIEDDVINKDILYEDSNKIRNFSRGELFDITEENKDNVVLKKHKK